MSDQTVAMQHAACCILYEVLAENSSEIKKNNLTSAWPVLKRACVCRW